jgi:hypothetical protein
MEKLYKVLAGLVNARATCIATGNKEWEHRHEERILALVKNHMPSGSGFDNGTQIDLDASTDERLVFDTGFHHMNGVGYYVGWTDHRVIVTPSLHFGVKISIRGRDHNDIKDYAHECFHLALTSDIDPAKEYANAEAPRAG